MALLRKGRSENVSVRFRFRAEVSRVHASEPASRDVTSTGVAHPFLGRPMPQPAFLSITGFQCGGVYTVKINPLKMFNLALRQTIAIDTENLCDCPRFIYPGVW